MTIAPKASSSPWAKFVNPVVPKMSDRPTAASAMINPKRMPLASRLAVRSTSDGPAESAAPPAPRRNTTVRSPESRIRGEATERSSSTNPTPSGSVSTSRVTSYCPAPGTSTATEPSSAESARPTSSPVSSVTTIVTPPRGSSSRVIVAVTRGPVSSVTSSCPAAAGVPRIADEREQHDPDEDEPGDGSGRRGRSDPPMWCCPVHHWAAV